jgi:hypothetical protein
VIVHDIICHPSVSSKSQAKAAVKKKIDTVMMQPGLTTAEVWKYRVFSGVKVV